MQQDRDAGGQSESKRERAEMAMHRLRGVVSVRNSIRVKPRVVATGLKDKIAAAFRRNAQLDAEVRDLKEGLEMVEEKARFELGMVKPDEILVQMTSAKQQ